MAVDYPQMQSAWAQTARQAAELDAGNRALVINYLASAAQHTAAVLGTHGNAPEWAADADTYAQRMCEQDQLRKGLSTGARVWTALGFGSFIGVVLGAAGGLVKFISDVGQTGAQTDLKPLFAAVAGSGAALYALFRTIAAAVNAAPSAIDGATNAWDELWASADPAKRLVASNLDTVEREFFSGLGASRPSRAALNAVGPGMALLWMTMVGLPLALFVYFVYSSLTGATSEPTTPLFPTTTFP